MLALVPALLVARCGIWPSFPDELISGDGGTDARSDATSEGGEGGIDGGDAGDAAREASTDGSDASDADAAAPSWYGFRSCPAPSNTMSAVEPAFPRSSGADGGADGGDAGFTVVSGITSPRDISFDGAGNMIVAGRDGTGGLTGAFIVSSAGVVRTFYSSPQGNVTGARYLTNGSVVLAGSYPMGASVLPGITVLDSTGMVQSRLAFPTGFPWALVSQSNGGFTVFDSQLESQIVQFTSSTLPMTLPTRVDTTMAVAPGPTQQRAAAMSADNRHMFVVSQDNGLIHEYEVTEAGVITGSSRRVFANLGNSAFPRSIAFDECGNLYATTTATVGATQTGALVRIPARGGTPFTLATFEQTDSQRTIAFGQGTGFSNTHIYVADVSLQIIRRVPIGIAGQPVNVPGVGMMMPPRDL